MMCRRQPLPCSAIAGFLVVATLTSGCVSRHVESIGSEEAAEMSPPPPPVSTTVPAGPTTPATDPGSAPEGSETQDERQAGIEVAVTVDPGVTRGVPAGATLYLIVRVAGREGGAPVAVKRLAGTVPITVTITEADAMMPGTPLIGDLDIIARIDQDGSATTREPGDLEGRVGPVQAGSSVSIALSPVGGGDGSGTPS